MKKYISLAALAMVSGFFSGNDVLLIKSQAWINFTPGIIFGVMVGIWLLTTQKAHLIKIILWSAVSAAAYYIAVNTAIFASSNFHSENDIFSFFAAGFVGAAILATGTYFLIVKLNFRQIFLLILLGSITGLTFSFGILGQPYTSYILWQTIVGVTLGIMVDQNKK